MVVHITITGTGSEVVAQLKQLAALIAPTGSEPPTRPANGAAIRPEENTEPALPVATGPALRVHEGEGGHEREPADEPATVRQYRAVFAIGKRLGLDEDALRAAVRSQLGHSMGSATKAEMSRVIANLQRTPAPEAGARATA
jgi:hypothetical protein